MIGFTKIGGEIQSSPLNDNFNKIAEQLDRNTSNLVFKNDEDAIVTTVEDMESISNPSDGQVCYVEATGSLYRYSSSDNQWHKIIDFRKTFKNNFLNSGVIAFEEKQTGEGRNVITADQNDNLIIPGCLVYFKTKEGDNNNIRGVYSINRTTIRNRDIDFDGTGYYSIYLNAPEEDATGNISFSYSIIKGEHLVDDPEKIYMGGFMASCPLPNQNAVNTIIKTFIYTKPNMAYTQDRSFFLANGGIVTNGILEPDSSGILKVSASAGKYYDEGINVPEADIENYSLDSNNGSNYNIRQIGGRASGQDLLLIHISPKKAFEKNRIGQMIESHNGVIKNNKYYDSTEDCLKDIPTDKEYFTILRHFITPSGEDCTDIISFGDKLYNSMQEAMDDLYNNITSLDYGFPCVEIARIVISSNDNIYTSDSSKCKINVLNTFTKAPNYENYMEKAVYADTNDYVKKSRTTDTLQEDYTVNSNLGNTYLWTSTNIKANTPETYYGTTDPSNSLGKIGDIYIKLENDSSN